LSTLGPFVTTELVRAEIGCLLDCQLGPADEAALCCSATDGEIVVEPNGAVERRDRGDPERLAGDQASLQISKRMALPLSVETERLASARDSCAFLPTCGRQPLAGVGYRFQWVYMREFVAGTIWNCGGLYPGLRRSWIRPGAERAGCVDVGRPHCRERVASGSRGAVTRPAASAQDRAERRNRLLEP
jgi:hypothetical protein